MRVKPLVLRRVQDSSSLNPTRLVTKQPATGTPPPATRVRRLMLSLISGSAVTKVKAKDAPRRTP